MFEKTVLDNGLRIVSMKLPSVATSVGVYVGVGARNEDLTTEFGLSHYLEHMAFKGTSVRTCEEIARQIEYSGGSTNASTSHTRTNYYASVINTEVYNVTEIILDSVFNSIFPVDDIETERGVIKQEIKMINDRPNAVAFYNLIGKAWPGQAVGSNIIGTAESLDSFSQQSFFDYVSKWYVPNNAVLAAAGDVDHNQLVEVAQRLVGHLPRKDLNELPKAKYQGGLTHFDKDFQQVNIILGWQGYPYSDIRKEMSANLAMNYLSGGMSSPLFVEVREKRGLVYGIGGGHMPHFDTGLTYVAAGAETANIDEIINVTLDTIRQYEAIDVWQLERAKNQTKISIMKNAESSGAMMRYMGGQWLMGDKYLRPVEDIIQDVDSITPEEISEVIRETLGSKLTISMVGPVADSTMKLAEDLTEGK